MTSRFGRYTDTQIAKTLALALAVDEGPTALAAYLDDGFARRAHSDLIGQAVTDTFRDRSWLMINTPPQVGKSTVAVVWSAFWWLINDPSSRVIILSYNDDLATERGRDIRSLITRNGHQFGLQLAPGAGSVKDYRITVGGGVFSVGVGGGVTGKPGDLIIVDDLIRSRADADSKRIRDRAWQSLSADVMTRRSPDAPVIFVCTLWHHDDPAHRLINRDATIDNGGKWRRVMLPAIATTTNDPLGRAVGDPLPHPKLPPDDTEILNRWWSEQRGVTDPRDWAALYQCDAKPREGALLQSTVLDNARRLREKPHIAHSILAIDPNDADSIDASASDACGISYAARDTDGLIWILADHTMYGSVDDWCKRVIDLADEYDVDEIVYERNKGGNAVALALKAAWSSRIRGDTSKPRPRISDVTATRNKITRASPVAQMLRDGEAILGGYMPELEDQLTTYQAGSQDSPDNMDAMVWAATHLYRPRRRNPGGGVNLSEVRIGQQRTGTKSWR